MPPLYTTPSPWTSMKDLEQLFGENSPAEPNASYDPSVQANINSQNNMTPELPTEMPEPIQPPPIQMGGRSSSSTPADMSGLNRLLSQLNEGNVQGIGLQKDELDRLKKYRDSLPTTQSKSDLTGLMALADAWGDGSQKVFTGAYKRPETSAELAAKQAAVGGDIFKEGSSISDKEMGLLKDKLSGEIAKIHYGQIKKDQSAAQDDRFTERVVGKYNGDKSVQKALGVEDAAGNIQGLLASNNAIADASIPTFMARLSGEVGNLSEADKKPFGGSQAFGARFEAAYEQAKSGKLTPENREFIAGVTQTLAKRASDIKEKRARELSDQYGRSHSGASPESVFGVLAPGVEYAKPKPGTVHKHGYEYSMGSDGMLHRGRKL